MSSDSNVDSNSPSPSLDVASPDNSSEGTGIHASSSVLLRILDPSVYFLLWLSTNIGCALILYLFYKTSQLREVSGYLMVTITCIDMFIAQVILFNLKRFEPIFLRLNAKFQNLQINQSEYRIRAREELLDLGSVFDSPIWVADKGPDWPGWKVDICLTKQTSGLTLD